MHIKFILFYLEIENHFLSQDKPRVTLGQILETQPFFPEMWKIKTWIFA